MDSRLQLEANMLQEKTSLPNQNPAVPKETFLSDSKFQHQSKLLPLKLPLKSQN